jgi:hypothetical protein
MTFLGPAFMQSSLHHLNHLFMMYDDQLMFFTQFLEFPMEFHTLVNEYFKWNVEPIEHPI